MTAFDEYIKFAKFRLNTLRDIKSKRHNKLVLRDIDKEMTRIANSINRGYTLGSIREDVLTGLYRPYRYFDITWSEINNDRDLNVVITRGSHSITVTDENWSQFRTWCCLWKVTRPETFEECENPEFYSRWW